MGDSLGVGWGRTYRTYKSYKTYSGFLPLRPLSRMENGDIRSGAKNHGPEKQPNHAGHAPARGELFWLVKTLIRTCLLLFGALITVARAGAQTIDPGLYDCMRWRCIGPFRGGRTVAAASVPSQPGVFFIGVNNGGVWKTNDYGRVWTPVFDDQ